MITTDEGKHLKPERTLYEDHCWNWTGCFGIFSTYDNARDTLEDIFDNFGEKLVDKENTPTGHRYFTDHSTWELEKFKVDELVQ